MMLKKKKAQIAIPTPILVIGIFVLVVWFLIHFGAPASQISTQNSVVLESVSASKVLDGNSYNTYKLTFSAYPQASGENWCQSGKQNPGFGLDALSTTNPDLRGDVPVLQTGVWFPVTSFDAEGINACKTSVPNGRPRGIYSKNLTGECRVTTGGSLECNLQASYILMSLQQGETNNGPTPYTLGGVTIQPGESVYMKPVPNGDVYGLSGGSVVVNIPKKGYTLPASSTTGSAAPGQTSPPQTSDSTQQLNIFQRLINWIKSIFS